MRRYQPSFHLRGTRVTKSRFLLLLATSSLAFSTSVLAQETPAPQPGNDAIAASQADAPAAQGDAVGLGEIVVTAQRRSENLTSVPLSISAQTGAGLAASGVKDLTDIKFSTPGFIAQSGTGYTQIYIRGI